MPDSYYSVITIGGAIEKAKLAELAVLLEQEVGHGNWQAELEQAIARSRTITVEADEVSWGRFEDLEPWLRQHDLFYRLVSTGHECWQITHLPDDLNSDDDERSWCADVGAEGRAVVPVELVLGLRKNGVLPASWLQELARHVRPIPPLTVKA